MTLHPYARARRAYALACDYFAGARVPQRQRGGMLILGVMGELLGLPIFTPEGQSVENMARVGNDERAAALMNEVLARRRAEFGGVRFLLSSQGEVRLENASRAQGSPEAALPSCLLCGCVVEDVHCDACLDRASPPRDEAEASHRTRVRAFLANGRVASIEGIWRKVGALLAERLSEAGEAWLQARPLALPRSGFFCATTASPEVCEALERAVPAVRGLLVEH